MSCGTALRCSLCLGLAWGALGAAPATGQDAPSQTRPLTAGGERWLCSERSKQVCTVNGCQTAPANAQVTLLLDAGEYLRCEGDYCDNEKIERIAGSGLFTTIHAGESILFKVVNDGAAYTEIVAHGLTSLIGHGTCKPAP